MNSNKMQHLQQQFLELQSKISETASSENVEITMDGKMEVTRLVIKTDTVTESLIEEIKTATNAVIKQASQKVQQIMMQLQSMAQ